MEDVVKRLEAVAEKLEKVQFRGSGSGGAAADDDLPEFVEYYEEVITSAKGFGSKCKASPFPEDITKMTDLIVSGFQLTKDFLIMSAKSKKPTEAKIKEIGKPFADLVQSIKDIEGKCRKREVLNHLKACVEISSAFMWVLLDKRPANYVKEMIDAGMFYTNKVLTEFKGKEPHHKEYVDGLLGVFRALFKYVEEYHKQGLAWNLSGVEATFVSKSSVSTQTATSTPAAAAASTPSVAQKSSGGAANLFAAINKGSGVTTGLKKVDDSQKTHKNPDLRGGSTVKETTTKSSSVTPKKTTVVQKPPVFELQNKKWVIENQSEGILNIEEGDLSYTLYMYKCNNTSVVVKNKINSITIEGCNKCAVVIEKGIISSCDMINSKRTKVQAGDMVPTVSINGCDDIEVHLAETSLTCEVITSKSSGINVLPMTNGPETVELFVPEQFRSVFVDGKLVTEPVVHE